MPTLAESQLIINQMTSDTGLAARRASQAKVAYSHAPPPPVSSRPRPAEWFATVQNQAAATPSRVQQNQRSEAYCDPKQQQWFKPRSAVSHFAKFSF
jgi:hypothetical protein